MGNLFALRSTDPAHLYTAADPIGVENNDWISAANEVSAQIVVAWGAHGSFRSRDDDVLRLLKNPYCLGVTKGGQPRHPLYLRGDTLRTRFAKDRI